jgi:hypothetical protein
MPIRGITTYGSPFYIMQMYMWLRRTCTARSAISRQNNKVRPTVMWVQVCLCCLGPTQGSMWVYMASAQGSAPRLAYEALRRVHSTFIFWVPCRNTSWKSCQNCATAPQRQERSLLVRPELHNCYYQQHQHQMQQLKCEPQAYFISEQNPLILFWATLQNYNIEQSSSRTA